MGRSSLVTLLAIFVGACANGPADEQPAVAHVVDDRGAGPNLPRAGQLDTGSPLADPSEPTTSPAALENVGPLFRAAHDGTPATSLNTFNRYEAALQSDGTMTIATKKGLLGSDPVASDYHGGSFYNGGTFRYAAVVSPAWEAAKPFDRVTSSFEAVTPPGTWVEIYVSAHVAATGAWTKDYSLGVWAYDDAHVRRHSVEEQKDASGDVVTDTLELASPADALQITVVLFSSDATTTPTLRAVSAITTLRSASPPTSAGDPLQWGKTLAVPRHSHVTYAESSAAWSSPTSTSMLLAYWGVDESPAFAAEHCHDIVGGGPSNAPFNTAYATATPAAKLHGMVTSLSSFAQVEPLIAKGVPVAIRLAYGNGELAGAPLASAAAHTIVVKGFTPTGNVVVNDPAFANDGAVETTYDRAELTAAWRRAGGTTYVLWPATQKLPVDPLGAY